MQKASHASARTIASAAGLIADLCSDTVTQPSEDMRAAMARAVVGDEQRREDPTVLELEERVAALLAKDDAVFLPSGTMCNIVALFVHCSAGDEVVMADKSHPVYAENAGPAVHSRVSLALVTTSDGVFSGRDIENAIQPDGPQRQRTRVVAVENTSSLGGGTIWPLSMLDEVRGVAEEHRLITHMDGARLLNAAVASGVAPSTVANGFDSVWIDLSKGLGCPMGAVLAGGAEFIADARRAKHLFGGALRQAGFAAAAGLFALDNNLARLADDHAHAQLLASGLRRMDGVKVRDGMPETNIVLISIDGDRPPADVIVRYCLERRVRFGMIDAKTLRAVTHMHIDQTAVDDALSVLEQALESSARPRG